jgi:hypothetical protein
MMKYLIDIDRIQTVDLLRGDEAYKELWVSKRRERKGVIVFSRRIKGLGSYVWTRHVLPKARSLKGYNRVKGFFRRNVSGDAHLKGRR